MDWTHGILGGLGAGLVGNMFGGHYKNPADAANQYLGAIPTYMQQFYAPYMQQGLAAGGALPGIYQNMIQRPGGLENDIGMSYKQSPGFDFALKQALQGASHAAAAGGMAGSPAHQQEAMDVASGLASRDYNQWLQNAMGLYGQGLRGEEGLYSGGFNASSNFADQLAQALAAQAQLQYAGQANKNQTKGGNIGGILGGLGSFAGSLFGGPAGGAAGGGIGHWLGSLFG